MAASMAPTSPAVGDQSTAAWATDIALDVIDLASTEQVLLFTPGGNTDTPLAGTATWCTLGNVTVPAWATKCIVQYNITYGFATAVGSNMSMVIKIGSAAGAVNKRIMDPNTAALMRFSIPIADKVTGLSTGSQSVTISSTWTSGTGVIRLDTLSFVTAQFVFQP